MTLKVLVCIDGACVAHHLVISNK